MENIFSGMLHTKFSTELTHSAAYPRPEPFDKPFGKLKALSLPMGSPSGANRRARPGSRRVDCWSFSSYIYRCETEGSRRGAPMGNKILIVDDEKIICSVIAQKGLAGEVIPFEARIIAVPDAFDAMASLRPHQRTRSLEDVLLEMEQHGGRQFDPRILEIFLRRNIYGCFVHSPSSDSLTPAAESHGLWPWMHAPTFGRDVAPHGC